MYTNEEKTAIVNAANILNQANLDYVLILKDEKPENTKPYFSINTRCLDDDAIYYIRFLLNIMYSSAKDYLPEDLKPSKEKSEWMRDIVEAALKISSEENSSIKFIE